MSQLRKAYGTDNVWYTIVHRKRGERRGYRCGYRSEDRFLLAEIAKKEADSGQYSMVKIINADTDETVELFTKAKQ